MAASAAEVTDEEEQKFLECGLCFENDELKRLPCNPDHISCVTCLTKDSEKTKIIKCPTCRTVLDEGIDDIPSAGAQLDKFLCCDVCMRKEDKRKLAQMYCVICQKKFCKPHMDNHNEALDDHKRITMDEYKTEYRKVEMRRCEKHADHVYSVACEKCNGVFCAKCLILKSENCSDGSSHDFVDLQMLADQFVKLISDMKLWIFDKEECLLGLVKQLTRILSCWDSDTEEMITRLHNARDKQIKDLTKYEELEKTLLKLRGQSKSEVTSFLDDDVGNRLDKISRGVKRIDNRLYSHHQVDIVKSMKETEKMTEELINVEIPEYTVSDSHVKLVDKDTVQEAAMHIRKTSEFPLTIPEPTKPNPVKQSNHPDQTNVIPQQPEPHTITDPPTSTEFVSEHTAYKDVQSVCHYKQYTYVGRSGGVDRINDDGQVEEGFINAGDNQCCNSITVHDDKLYILLMNFPQHYKIQIFDLSGKLIGSWETHIDYTRFNKHRIIDNKLIIPDPPNKQLVVYSLIGDIIKHIPCDLCTGSPIALTVGGDNSVILSVAFAGIVFRINIDSGKVIWVSDHVTSPSGLVCYKNRYVLVTSFGSATRIWILDINTGACVGELIGKQRQRLNCRPDMDIYDDTLLVTVNGCDSIERYKINTS